MRDQHPKIWVHEAELHRDAQGRRWLKVNASMETTWALGDREEAEAVVDRALARLRTALLEYEGSKDGVES